MIRWIGALMIVAACSGAGWRGKRELRWRVRSLEEGERIAELLRMLVCVQHKPLPDMLTELENLYPGRLAGALDSYRKMTDISFVEYWSACMQSAGLSSEASTILSEAVSAVAGGQVPERAMNICQAKLNHCREAAHKREMECGRLCLAFGSAGGCLLALILL